MELTGVYRAILPILQSFSDSGHRSPQRKFLEALRENAKYQLIMLTIGIIGLVYVISTQGFHYDTIRSLIIALSYFYALTFAVYLMGHGLVALPRNLWRGSSVSARLRRLQIKAVKIHDQSLLANEALEEVEKEVWAVSKKGRGSAAEFQEWIEELVDSLQLPESSLAGTQAALNRTQRSRSPIPQIITEQYLASLTKRLRNASHKRARYSSAWDSLVRQASNAQAILDSSASKKLVFPPNPHSIAPVFQRWKILTPYSRYFVYKHIVPPFQQGLAVFLAAASICIIWSEIININKKASDTLSIVGLSVVHHRYEEKRTVGLAGQVIAAAWIAYMCAAAYDSMTSVKVWGNYALVRRRTSGSSACFYASYACRLTVPLAYNFTNFLPTVTVEPTVFQNFFGVSVNLTKPGLWFNDYFPILILIPVVATLFNLYSRVKNLLGFGYDVIEDSDEEASRYEIASGWREGRDLIERELGGHSTSHLSSNPSNSHTSNHNNNINNNTIRNGNNNNNNNNNTSTSNLLSTGDAPTPLSYQTRRPQQTTTTSQQQSRQSRQARLDTGVIPRTADNDQDGEEEGAIGAFFHRVKNTLDINSFTSEENNRPPKWLNDIGEAFKKPKWMQQGDEQQQQAGASGSSSSGQRVVGGAGGGNNNNGFAVNKPKWMTGNFFSDDD